MKRLRFVLAMLGSPMSSASGVPSYPSFPPRPAPPDISTIDPRLDLEAEIVALEATKKRSPPGALLPRRGHPGPGRLRRRLARPLPQGAAERRPDHRVRRASGSWPRRPRSSTRRGRSSSPTTRPAARSRIPVRPTPSEAWRDAHPGAVSLTYINCSAAVKALSDIIVTSSNAEKIVRSIPERPGDPLRAGPAPRRVPGEDARPRR